MPSATWGRPLASAWRAVFRYGRLTERAARFLSACQRLRETNPRRALLLLHRAAADVRKADELRGRAVCYVLDSGQAEIPRHQLRRVRFCALDVLSESNEKGQRLDEVMEQLKQVTAALAGLEVDEVRPSVSAPWSRLPLRRFLGRRLRSAAERILALFQRRQRSKAAAPADAPPKLSRGRAPPSFSPCPI